jgi:hypothetical protein
VLALLAGLAFTLPRWRRRPAAPPGAGDEDREGDAPAQPSADEAKRLEEDLARYGA